MLSLFVNDAERNLERQIHSNIRRSSTMLASSFFIHLCIFHSINQIYSTLNHCEGSISSKFMSGRSVPATGIYLPTCSLQDQLCGIETQGQTQ